jgi:hypothetical protein
MGDKMQWYHEKLQEILSDPRSRIEGASFIIFTPDVGFPYSSSWNIPISMYKKKSRWLVGSPGSSRVQVKSKKKNMEKECKEPPSHETFPIVATFPHDGSSPGLVVDKKSQTLNALFKKPGDCYGFLEDIFHLRQDMKQEYADYFESSFSNEARNEYGFSDEKIDFYKKTYAIAGEFWNKKTHAGVLMFELMDGLDIGTVLRPGGLCGLQPELYSGVIGSLQIIYEEVPFVRFPGKPHAQLVANFFQSSMRSQVGVVAHRVDTIMLGSTNNGKTTLVRHFVPNDETVETTHFYDVYLTNMIYDGQKGDSIDPKIGNEIGVVFWDLGWQKKFWKSSIYNLPEKLFPEIARRKPQICVLTYAGDSEYTFNELQEQIEMYKQAMGEENWKEAYKILVRTKVDKPGVGRLLEGEIRPLANELGADTYIQVDARNDSEIIINTLKRGAYKQVIDYLHKNQPQIPDLMSESPV